jgi:glycogen debranching enzyme
MEPNEYQNSAVWPWFTALHIEAELRYGDRRYAYKLLRTVFPFCFFEWYNPYNPRKKGFYPFRTSASAILKVTRAKPDLLSTSEKDDGHS